MRRVLVVLVVLVWIGLPASASAPNAGDPALQRLKLTPAPGTTFKIVAEYDNAGVRCEANKRRPLRARYAGNLEIVREADGSVALVNALTFAQYLEGLAEVPRSWPLEALKAQVVAARSYALYHYEHGRESPIGYDLCSTDACQVYRGLQVSEGAFGEAWKRAVRETAARVLLHGGRPIEAFYFSTSWGRTVTNVEGFGAGTALPYLRPTTGEDDDAPLAHWHVEIPLTDLGPILRAAGAWTRGSISSASVNGAEIVVTDGVVRTRIALTDFRRAVNAQADCLYPQRYPPRLAAGGRLPQTIPSPHLTVAVRGGHVVADGRGWGHGVGMSQYGARSLASRGRTAPDILAHFYGGLRPQPYREPGLLRVLLAQDAVRITVEADGPFRARGPNGDVRLGPRFAVQGGRTMTIVRAGSITPVLTVNPLAPEVQRAVTGGTAIVQYVLPTSAKVRPFLMREGSIVVRGAELSQVSGSNTATITLADERGAPLPPGIYGAGLEASDGIDHVRADAVTVQVLAPAPPPRPARPPSGRSLFVPIAVAIVVLASAATALGAMLGRPRRAEPR